MKDDRVYLLHIAECIRRIEEVSAGGKEELLCSHMRQDAILRNLQTLTEATTRLSELAKTRHPEVDWRAMAAFRNVLVHDYLGIDLERVWSIATKDVPALKPAVEAPLGSTESKG